MMQFMNDTIYKHSKDKNKDRTKIKFYVFLAILFFVFFISLLIGRYMISISDIIIIIKSKIFGLKIDNLAMENHIFWEMRLPRGILAMLVGAGLAVSGASFQGIFKNPLVSPDILGVCNGAGFGAALGIILTNSLGYNTALLAFLFALISAILTFSIAKLGTENEILSFVLAGIIVSSTFSALISLIKYVADPNEQLPAITFWLMGSFSSITYEEVRIAIFPILIGISILLAFKWRINVLSLGDDEAISLGVNPKLTRVIVIIASTIVTATCVVVSGVIGWVGLVIPHIARILVGSEHSKLLPFSCILGAIFMLISDSIARSLTASEIPIGIITALIGAPFFAIVFKKSRGGD